MMVDGLWLTVDGWWLMVSPNTWSFILNAEPYMLNTIPQIIACPYNPPLSSHPHCVSTAWCVCQ
jgi:hypothetical protein